MRFNSHQTVKFVFSLILVTSMGCGDSTPNKESASSASAGFAANERSKLADQTPPDSDPENANLDRALEPLKRLVGTWEKVITVYEPGTSDIAQSKSGTHTAEWILNNQHIQEKGADSDGLQYLSITTFDSNSNEYRNSIFQSNGNSLLMTGNWDETRSTFTWTSKDDSNTKIVATYEFIGTDRVRFKFTTDNDSGEIILASGTGTRIK